MIKILVVDDELGVCESIQKTFSYIGFSVFTATKPSKALSILKRNKPKIVFLDIELPDIDDGLGVLRQMKEIDPGLIVIAIASEQDDDVQKSALSQGADDFITKPFSHNYLRDVAVQKIKELLDKGGHMQKPRILLVDDEKGIRSSLTSFIDRKFECDIDAAADAETAILKVKSTQPDLILLDIKMPGLSGIDAISQIRALSPESKILIVSAWKSMEVVNQAIAAGATDYISKPISLSVLQEKLKSFLIMCGKLILK